MAKKPVTSDVIEDTVETVSETPEVVITEQVEAAEERKLSAQTLLEMEAGREALKAYAASARAERGE